MTRVLGGLLMGALLMLAWIGAPVAGQTATAKATKVSDKELVTLAQNAKTPADHERLAAYYADIATDLEAKSTTHKELAELYRRMPTPGGPRVTPPNYAQLAKHCDNIAANAAKLSEEARTMAEHHRMLAKSVGTAR